MLGEIGTLLTGLALVTTFYAAFAALWHIRTQDQRWAQSAQNAVNAVAGLLGAALLILLFAFLSNNFSIRYVAQHSSTMIPIYLKISAIWAGQEGSLLLWCFLQALFAALATARASEAARPLVPWATVFLNLITAFFLAVSLLLSNPFALLARPMAEGQGLNPLLRHPGMIFHPPALYVGYVGLAVPFAFAMAALVTAKVKKWTAALHTWILVAWLGLSLGLLLGMRWAYDVLGWGGYWGWDPVENAGLLPWFTATALLHGSVMQDEKRGFQIWNMLLVIFSFVLVLFGTFATRSGMIQSVHAYATSNLGVYFLTAIFVTLAGALGLLYARRAALTQNRATETLLSRDGMFFLTLVLLSLLTVSVFIGSVLPTITEVLTARRFEAGPAWFDRVTGPQFAALVLVMGMCPLLGRAASALRRLKQRAWVLVMGVVALPVVGIAAGFTQVVSWIGFAIVGLAGAVTLAEYVEGVTKRRARTGEAPLNALWRLLRLQRRKYGGYLVHTGIILMALGVIGTRLYPFEVERTLKLGDPTTVGAYTLVFEDLQRDFIDDYTSTWATVSIYHDDDYLITLEPRLNQYVNTEQSLTLPALRPGLQEDVYLILSGWSNDGAAATFKVVINVLVNFLWLGGLLFLAGGALALWPRMTHPLWNAVALTVGVIVLAGAAWAMWGIPHGAAKSGAGRPLVGQPAPNFRLDLLDGDTVAPADFKGDVVVLNIWASWCPSCMEEMPHLQSVWKTYQDQDVIIIGAAYQDKVESVRASLATYGISYLIGLDTGDRIATLYGITGVPETHVIDAEGRIAYTHIGPVSEQVLSAEIETLLAP